MRSTLAYYSETKNRLEWEHGALSEDEVQWDMMQRKKKIKDEDDEESLTIGVFASERKVCSSE